MPLIKKTSKTLISYLPCSQLLNDTSKKKKRKDLRLGDQMIRRTEHYKYVFTQPLDSRRMWHKVSFKQNWLVSNSGFSIFSTGFHTSYKWTQFAQLFISSGRENMWLHPFPKRISALWNANRFELGSLCQFPSTISAKLLPTTQ